MRQIYRYFAIALLMMFWVDVSAQENRLSIEGKVSDVSGNPVSGVSIQIEGTTRGTFTGADGTYALEEVPRGSVLRFVLIGYATRELTVTTSRIVDLVLEEDTQNIEEVVVVGYGTTRRSTLVGAVGSVSGKEFEQRANMNITRSLQGMVPGLTITAADGKPSRGASINLRGMSSIGSGGSPLILIDGVEAHGDLTTVNPSDIASVSVLKDASSSAIYGAKGAFGVILITTREAEKGVAKVTYSGNVSLLRRLNEPELVWNGKQWTDGWYKAYIEGNGTVPNGINNVFLYNQGWYDELVRRDADPSLEKVRVNSDGLYEYFGNTNWFDVIYRDLTTSTEHNLSVSGGNDNSSYYLSGRYFNQKGIYTEGNENFTQYNFRAKGKLRLNRMLTVENNTDFISRGIHQPMVMYDRQLLLRQLQHQGYPMTMPKNPDGTWTETAVYTGWAGFVEGTSYQRNKKFDLKNTTALTFTPIESLIFKADYSYYFNHSERDRVENMYTFYTGPLVSKTRNTFSSLEHISYNNEYQSGNITGNWIPKFRNEDHFLNVLVGWQLEHMYTKNVTTYRRGLLYEEKPTFAMMDGDIYTVSQSGSEWAYAGLLYRANYNFRERYLFEVSGRYDGSTKFPSNSRWGFFPSLSLGWRVSEEGFMEGTRHWLDNLKVRFSAGSLGNGNVGAFSYMSLMSIARTGVLIGGGQQSYTSVPGLVPSSLTWETNTTYDAGLDVDMLDNRLNFVFDYYRRNTTDMYTVGPDVPAVFGTAAPRGNNADMKTLGYEVSLQWRDNFELGGSPFSYNIRGMMWDSRSWITKFYNATKSLSTYYEGMEVGEIWGYHIEGLYRDQNQIDSHADQSAIAVGAGGANVLKPGDLMFADLDNDGKVNNGDNTADSPGDRRVIGNSSLRYNFGLNLGANWKGVGVSAFFQGVGKRDWYPHVESAFFWGQYDRPYSYMLQAHTGDNVWSEENPNPNAYWPRYRGYLSGTARSMGQTNDRYLQNAAYVRLKTLQIDYTFGPKVCRFLHISDLRVYLSGENLWTWSPMFRVTRNFDPEVLGAGDIDFRSTAGSDGDGYGYPMQKTYTLGVNITF